jgi:hypothetical protein
MNGTVDVENVVDMKMFALNAHVLSTNTLLDDPLEALLGEMDGLEDDELETVTFVSTKAIPMAHMGQSVDQIALTLEAQLDGLRDGLDRLRYYLGDVQDTVTGL